MRIMLRDEESEHCDCIALLSDVVHAIDALANEMPRAALIARLHLFEGSTHESLARAIGVSRKTVAAVWCVARSWIAAKFATQD